MKVMPFFSRVVLSLVVCIAAANSFALELHNGERIALAGNSLAERMNLYGHFEAMLHARFAEKELVVRNFGRPADEVGYRQRPNDYTKLDDPLQVFGPETFICFFGYNESFAGPRGVDAFKTNYEAFLDEYAQKYGKERKARFVLVSPVAFENTGHPLQPDGLKINEHLKVYKDAIASVAAKRGLEFVDLYTPTGKTICAENGRTVHYQWLPSE